MASFFQPGSNDPTILECGESRFEFYCNSVLKSGQLLKTWYQYVDLSVGTAALVIPLSLLFLRLVVYAWKSGAQKRARLQKVGRKSKEPEFISETPHPFRSTRSFRIVSDSDRESAHGESRNYDLVMLPLSIEGERGLDGGSRVSALGFTNVPASLSLACIDVESLGENALDDADIPWTADFLADVHVRHQLSGLALRCSRIKRPEQMDKLLKRLQREQISVLLLCHHDSEVLDSLSFTNASGVIIENACILANGQRRDYFRARRLRDTMARCSKIREETPDFFIGFLELWEEKPHPSVIRRAVKLAEHFGAVVEHGPVNPDMVPGVSVKKATATLSGYEYLRRAESTELQKSWLMEHRKTWIPAHGPAPALSAFPLSSLDSVIPYASRLLEYHPLSSALQEIQDELPPKGPAPQFVARAPARDNFWDMSIEGHHISAMGCFPIMGSPTIEQYDAVVDTQNHLKDLDMLQLVKGLEAHRLMEAFKTLATAEGISCKDLIMDLAEGITSHRVCIYKGLDTGFRIPESDSNFWGVSKTRDDMADIATDIFISLKSPDDASTVLHTWMAHQGVSREERYNIELQLQAFKDPNGVSSLPLSIKTAIDKSTTSETLFFLQQTYVANLEEPLKELITSYCRLVLVDDTSKLCWKQFHAKSILDRSVSVRDILRNRLEYFARRGATELPTLGSLEALYELIEENMEDALFNGDREPLNVFTEALVKAYDPWSSWSRTAYVDINTDLFALIFFSILRRAAFEEVYIEATDRCPLFLSQPDQAAVFSELWVLGSQCDHYFGILPRDVGDIIYHRYRAFLKEQPPGADDRQGTEIMTMYSTAEAPPPKPHDDDKSPETSPITKKTTHDSMKHLVQNVSDFGAMSIFCLPAIIDVMLLTFIGRGMFMTAYMDPDHLQAAGYSLLISLLLTAGVTGWVGSTGNYYLAHFAYDNMIYFHVQRLSGGLVLTLLVAVGGLVGFGVSYSATTGFVFLAFVIVITTYLNLLGIMATMHQAGSPMTSGRAVIWRTIPVLFLSPIISSFVNGYDLAIYLPVTYLFLLLLLFQYRRLCHEWSTWLTNIPKFSDKDVLDWYRKKAKAEGHSDEQEGNRGKIAQDAFRVAVMACRSRSRDAVSTGLMKDSFVVSVAKGMPYIDWLFKKTCPNGQIPDLYSTSWFTQLGESRKQQEQLARGLKEHNILLLFRLARYDIGQNLGLFLIALMDRWVNITMGARKPHPSMYTDSRARYGICFCILYFCLSVMLLDATLQNYWSFGFKLSEERLVDFDHAREVAKQWEQRRHKTIVKAVIELLRKIMFVFGVTTILLWIFVESPETTIFYYLYILGYTCVIIFQFNRCFTTNVSAHIKIIFISALIGFIVGIVLHALPMTAGWLYTDVASQNISAVLAASGTFLWCWNDWSSPSKSDSTKSQADSSAKVWEQGRISADSAPDQYTLMKHSQDMLGVEVKCGDGSFVSETVQQHLQMSLEEPNHTARTTAWSQQLLERSLEMYKAGKITLIATSRQEFEKAGLSDICSFSRRDRDKLEITVGFLGETELHLPSWQQLLAILITESIMYHVALAELGLSPSKAVQAEHFFFETETISKRIEFELAFETQTNLAQLRQKTNRELMKHLCFDLDMDTKWDQITKSGREAILNRIIGQDVAFSWEFCQWMSDAEVDLQTSDFSLRLCLDIYHKASEWSQFTLPFSGDGQANTKKLIELKPVSFTKRRSRGNPVNRWFRKVSGVIVTSVQWIAVLSGAGSDVERELWYCLRKAPLRPALLWTILGLWKLCHGLRNFFIYWILIHNRPSLVGIMRLAQKGARRKIVGNSIVVEFPRKTITGFANANDEGMSLDIYEGLQKSVPDGKTPIFKALYDNKLRLVKRTDGDNVESTYHYPEGSQKRWPLSKEVVLPDSRTVGFYDKYGRISQGILTIGSTEFAFRYYFKSIPKENADILRADFKRVDLSSEDTFSVFWGVPLENGSDEYNWVPSDKVRRIVKVIDGRKFVTEIEYQHRRDPLITTFLEEKNGMKTAVAKTPKVFTQESVLLTRPHNLSFDSDDLLIHHGLLRVKGMRRSASTAVTRLSYLNPISWIPRWGARVYRQIPTWRTRTELWNHWLKSGNLDAATACWLDELVMREEPYLKGYWKARGSGKLNEAKHALDANIDQIFSAVEIKTDVSEVCQLPIKTSDLYVMGLGKDATEVTNRPQDCYKDTHERVSVIFNDIGCWPEAPGGVSNCRRDLVNGHSTIRNHVLAECANDFGIPRFQIEKNVQSIKLLPLWGLDGKNAHHGLISNLLQSQVDEKVWDTEIDRDIVGIFIPLLKGFVKGARTKNYTRANLIEATNVILSMSKYFEQKDYTRTWNSKEVEKAWVEAWLMPYDDPNITVPSDCFEIERPSMSDFREAMAIYLAYFFIFSVKIPDECPRVFQSTHHGISSLYGMILKYRKGVTFGIWDHAILWRETCLNISPAQCELPIAVQSMLLGGIGLATRLAYFHADVIMPCTSLFNPMWETEIGTDKGKLGNKNLFGRKIDPIVNGISNMESFVPVDKIRSEKPTVVMLSNVQFIKGIKTAILAADIIVNRYGFKDYQLVVYGAKDRQPSYALEMAKLIVENNLSDTVNLAGFGKPKEVLKDAWLFMNSSISEGLPLAIGEAALAGVPIVATEVGATALVLTDPKDQDQRYGEVVPPNDPVALARAQLSMLGMVGPWAKFTEDGDSGSLPTLPDEIGSSDVEWLTKRMYEKTDDRRKLGLLSREVVLHSFHGNRYLREHEQMYWIQWHLAKMREDPNLNALSSASALKFGVTSALRYADESDSDEADGSETGEEGEKIARMLRWQDFEKENESERKRPRKRLTKQPRVTSAEDPWV